MSALPAGFRESPVTGGVEGLRIAAALAVSLGLHAGVAAWLDLPGRDAVPATVGPVEVRLVSAHAPGVLKPLRPDAVSALRPRPVPVRAFEPVPVAASERVAGPLAPLSRSGAVARLEPEPALRPRAPTARGTTTAAPRARATRRASLAVARAAPATLRPVTRDEVAPLVRGEVPPLVRDEAPPPVRDEVAPAVPDGPPPATAAARERRRPVRRAPAIPASAPPQPALAGTSRGDARPPSPPDERKVVRRAPPQPAAHATAGAVASSALSASRARDRAPTRSTSPSVAPARLASAAPAAVAAVAQSAPRPPQPLAGNPKPRYPMLARRRGLEGSVLVRLDVDAAGNPSAVRVVTSSGIASLDEAAREAVARWRFAPARRLGRAEAATVDVPVEFRLDGNG